MAIKSSALQLTWRIDPLNLPKWRKIVFVLIASFYSATAGPLVSAFGSLLAFYIPSYAEQRIDEGKVRWLVSYPPLFQGLANLLFIPLANAIGRRPVFLMVCLMTILGALICAKAPSFNVHLGGRMIVGLGAGLGEALSPLMVSAWTSFQDLNDVLLTHEQEVHFLHERSTSLMWQSGVQGIGAAVFVLCASPIAGAIGPSNWYFVVSC